MKNVIQNIKFNKKIALLIIVGVLLIGVIGISYAYFSAVIQGNISDITIGYKTKDGTDMILSDRQEIYYNNQKNNFCQKNCSLVSYNINTKMENCNCKIQNEGIIKTDLNNIEKVEEENEVNEVLDQFFTTLENSNFLVMECYKLVFGEKGFKDNIGSIIMIISFFILLALFLTFVFYSRNKIKVYIFEIVDNIMKNPKINRNNNSKKDKRKNFEIQKKLKDSPKQQDLKLGRKCNTIIIKKKNNKESTKLIEKRKKAPPKKSDKKLTPLKQKQKIPAINKNRKNPLNVLIQINNSNNYNLNSLSPELDSSAGKNKLMNSNTNNNKQQIFLFNKKGTKQKLTMDLNNDIYLNDHELNMLEYDSALKMDKRTILQYYYGLIKRKQLIFFAFVHNKDYNSRVLKISLFIIAFDTLIVINGFFFSDETMHKIYELNGNVTFFYEITKMIYSTLISTMLNIFLRYLSLSEWFFRCS